MELKAVIFDLDGVVVSTDEYHYLGWKRLAEEEGIPYSRDVNTFQRGVSRMESLEVMLKNAPRSYSSKEKQEMAERKNRYYVDLIRGIRSSDILSGFNEFFESLRRRGIRCAIGSSSRNTGAILKGIGLQNAFDAVADGTQISRSKPDPEVFLLAAYLLGENPQNCAVVEDAAAGVEAALAGGMKVVAVGAARNHPDADIGVASLSELTADELIRRLNDNAGKGTKIHAANT
jgi:beta-phosphoglucomutase